MARDTRSVQSFVITGYIMSTSSPTSHACLTSFFEKIDISQGEHGCWLWQGTIGSDEYGRLKRLGKTYSAHRYSYELFKGPIPEEMCVLHSCDTPSCINPKHLFLGTKQDNHHDMMTKGHQGDSTHRLTKEEVGKIRQRAEDGETKNALARQFGVCRSTIQDLVAERYHHSSSDQPHQLLLFELEW